MKTSCFRSRAYWPVEAEWTALQPSQSAAPLKCSSYHWKGLHGGFCISIQCLCVSCSKGRVTRRAVACHSWRLNTWKHNWSDDFTVDNPLAMQSYGPPAGSSKTSSVQKHYCQAFNTEWPQFITMSNYVRLHINLNLKQSYVNQSSHVINLIFILSQVFSFFELLIGLLRYAGRLL